VVVVVAVAAVVGMASIAAAAPGDPAPGDPVVEAPDATPDDESVADTPDDVVDAVPVPDDTGEDAGEGETSEAAAPADEPEGCLTHGQRVSALARSTPPGPDHGKVVSAAARSHEGECGDEGEPPEPEPTEPEPTEPEPTPEPEPTVNAVVAAPSASGPVVGAGGPPAHAASRGNGHAGK
jgi:hypothetical protein